MTKVNKWEKSLVKKGTELVKFYFSIDKDQQKRRINARKNSKLKYWKLSESDKLMVNNDTFADNSSFNSKEISKKNFIKSKF